MHAVNKAGAQCTLSRVMRKASLLVPTRGMYSRGARARFLGRSSSSSTKASSGSAFGAHTWCAPAAAPSTVSSLGAYAWNAPASAPFTSSSLGTI